MLSTAHNTKPFKLDSFRSSLRPRRALNCILGTVCIVSVCAIAVVSAIVVREYSLSQAYEPIQCRLLNLTYTPDEHHCVYCSGTIDKTKERKVDACQPVAFPCLRVTVSFDVHGDVREGLLYTDTNQATGQQQKCSFSVCHKTHQENAKEVKEFAGTMAAHGNSTFLCYYDTETLDNVILKKSYSKMDVFHYLFWPSLAIAICGLIFLHAECHRKGMVVCPCEKSRSNTSPSAQESSSPAVESRAKETKKINDDLKVVRGKGRQANV